MRRQFRVDAILTTLEEPERLTKLARETRTPVILMGTEPQLARDAGCAGFLPREAEPPMIGGFLHLVISRERQAREVA
jgi:hypothetical protein